MKPNPPLTASTIDTGYTLSPNPLENPFTSDAFYQRTLSWYLPPEVFSNVAPRLQKFGDDAVSPRVNDWMANAEKQEPYVKQYDAWGRRYPYDKLITSEGWKRLGDWGARNGCVLNGGAPYVH